MRLFVLLEMDDNSAGIAESIGAKLDAAKRVTAFVGSRPRPRIISSALKIVYRDLLGEVFHLHGPNRDVFLQLYIDASSGDHGKGVCRP